MKPPPPRRVGWFSATAALLLLLLLAFASGWTASRPVVVRLDGSLREIPPRTTISQAISSGWLACTPGDLLAIDGSIVDYGAGDPPTVTRNGAVAAMGQRIYPGDVVEGFSGKNRSESVVTTDVTIPFKTRYEGQGPLVRPKTLGAPGVRRVTMGERSGVEVTSTVLLRPTDMVILRERPDNGRLVALTFDDGPFPGQTERILDVLKKYDVKATFFMLGIQVKRQPGLARRVVREGHGVGSHTYWHHRLDLMTPAGARAEIRGGNAELLHATGVRTKWMRPPYGAVDYSSWNTMRSMKMNAVLWDVDSRDWTRPGARNIAYTVLHNTRPGSVVLMHDGGGDRLQTAQALTIIIPRLQKAGYTFVTLDELTAARREARVLARRRAVAAAKRKAAAAAAAKRRPKPAAQGG